MGSTGLLLRGPGETLFFVSRGIGWRLQAPACGCNIPTFGHLRLWSRGLLLCVPETPVTPVGDGSWVCGETRPICPSQGPESAPQTSFPPPVSVGGPPGSSFRGGPGSQGGVGEGSPHAADLDKGHGRFVHTAQGLAGYGTRRPMEERELPLGCLRV